MSSLTIVAIPAQDDYVYKISSEKVPHMTLLFLGDDVNKIKNLDMIINFVKHAADTTLMRFGMEVDRRGTLGPDLADVLFFSKSKWSGFETINHYRLNLLKDNNIRTAYDSTTQFPEWIPHLTLGYPDTPAKPDERDYPGISYVNFDRIAVWDSEYEGIEFPLKTYTEDLEVAMSDATSEIVKNVLSHVGVKGMRWGVRRSRSSDVAVNDKRKKIKTSGGYGHPASADALRARRLGQVGKKSGLKALSNQELQSYAQRLQLEQSVKRLNYNEMNPGKKFVATVLGQSGKSLASEGVNKGTKEAGKRALKLAMAA